MSAQKLGIVAGVDGSPAAKVAVYWAAQEAAMRPIGEIADAKALPALTAALKDEDAGVRRAAVQALAG